MRRTRIVHVKKEPFDVYIGRAFAGQPASQFANPFKIGPDGSRADVIAKYRRHLLASPALLEALATLRGKTLACWCKPEDCHGDVLVQILEGEPAAPTQMTLI